MSIMLLTKRADSFSIDLELSGTLALFRCHLLMDPLILKQGAGYPGPGRKLTEKRSFSHAMIKFYMNCIFVPFKVLSLARFLEQFLFENVASKN